MTKEQSIHVGMLNSYNLLLGNATLEQILMSGIGVFAHAPDEETAAENIKFIITYFQTFEMFEHCAELKWYLEENYNKDGTPKVTGCECPLPHFTEYSSDMRCSQCKKRLRL